LFVELLSILLSSLSYESSIAFTELADEGVCKELYSLLDLVASQEVVEVTEGTVEVESGPFVSFTPLSDLSLALISISKLTCCVSLVSILFNYSTLGIFPSFSISPSQASIAFDKASMAFAFLTSAILCISSYDNP